MSVKWNIESVQKLFSDKNYKLITTKYKNTSTPLLVKNPSGYIGKISVNNFIQGKSFKIFKTDYSARILKHNIKTAMQYNQIETQILDVFIKDKKVWVLFKCSCCNVIYQKPVWKFLNSPYCVQCGNNLGHKLPEHIIRENFNAYGYEILQYSYINSNTPLMVKDNEGYIGYLSYNNLQQGTKFKRFRSNNIENWIIKHNVKTYLSINKLNHIKLLGVKRKQGRLWIQTTCPKCSRKIWRMFEKVRKHPYQNYCKSCNPHRSELELFTKELLQQLRINFIEEYKINGYYRFDFYLPDYNLCIEVDDAYHFYSKNIHVRELDKAKNELCSKVGIKLLRIPYWEFPDNYKKIIINALK